MNWFDYLSLLSWQNCKITKKDFINLQQNQDIQNPENLISIMSTIEGKEYLMSNKYWWKKAEQDYKHLKKRNYKLLSPNHLAYPKQFLDFFENIPIFLVLGDLPFQNKLLPVTFVGSRKADELVLNWMDFYLPSLIKKQSICIVSGGARGIDQKAHTIAIRSQKPTLCFLPSGLDHLYPNSLNRIKTAILDNGGAFISCFPPWAEMRKSYFHIRNSFMSAYSTLVVILQAQLRSGTMLTAKKSLDFGVPLAVLPGPALSVNWTGNLQLIYDGANLIRDNIDLSILIESLNLTTKLEENQTEALATSIKNKK